MKLLTDMHRGREGPSIAQVTFSESGDFGAARESERRGMPVFSARGIAYRPCEGDNLLLIPVDGADVCAGVLAAAEGLEAGELSLTSSGGARIHLKNNGEVVINGLVITREGRLIER